MFVSLYTTRLILQSLGSSDYGIFSVVGGAITMLGFLNSTLAYTTQRFLTYAEGEGNHYKQCKIFNISLSLHVLIAVLTVLFQLGVMYPLFNGILNIPDEREVAAKIVYLCLIFSTIITIVNATYDAVLNAHENMRFYSLIGILDALLRLLVVIACSHTSYDRLIFYGILMALIPVITHVVTRCYCDKKYSECKVDIRKYWDYKLVKEIATFSGWNFFIAMSSLFSVQGVGLTLNHFYGSKLNAAQGIAIQLNGYLSVFASNMIKAINPTIVKSAGAKATTSMHMITLLGCKYSTYLIMLFAVPCILEIKFLLKIWLGPVPDWTALFCILQITQAIMLQMVSPIATAVYAQGNIKFYSIFKTTMNLMPLLTTYIAFSFGAPPYWLYILMIIFYVIGGNVVIMVFAKKNCNFSFMEYFKDVSVPIHIVLLIMFVFGLITILYMQDSFLRLITTAIFTSLGFILGVFSFGMKSFEKVYIKSTLSRVRNKFFRI